jgi:hypothetical protein
MTTRLWVLKQNTNIISQNHYCCKQCCWTCTDFTNLLPICCWTAYKTGLITFVVWGFHKCLVVYDAFFISNQFSVFRRTLLPHHYYSPERSWTTLKTKAVSPPKLWKRLINKRWSQSPSILSERPVWLSVTIVWMLSCFSEHELLSVALHWYLITTEKCQTEAISTPQRTWHCISHVFCVETWVKQMRRHFVDSYTYALHYSINISPYRLWQDENNFNWFRHMGLTSPSASPMYALFKRCRTLRTSKYWW